MHFALPPKKGSHTSRYAPRSSRIPLFRRSRLKHLFICGLAIGAIIFVISRVLRNSDEAPFTLISSIPPVVIVTVLETASYGTQYSTYIKENREEYARRHGYVTFFPESSDYNLDGSPSSWAKIPALRHAMTKWQYSTYFWLLDQNALIMNLDQTIESVMDPKQMEKSMIRDQPIVPPDSVIRTFSHIKAKEIEFVLTQDKDGLTPGTFILKRGEWAKFFLDTWFDPLFRSYNFQKADRHALEHIVQWHPTILARLALISQKILYSNSQDDGQATSIYTKGDFVVRFNGCEVGGENSCETVTRPYMKEWRQLSNT